MENFMPEEIQKKVKSIEKELNENSFSDNKLALWFSLIGVFIGLALIFLYSFITNRTGFYPLVIFVLAFSLAGNAITRFSEHKKISKLLINVCEVINYYRNKETQ
ncbi:MAG: hypothetical protein GX654_02970 [Desulfatiglans sp.]|nr:hypothetical protein [Desulfatiglans sp.]